MLRWCRVANGHWVRATVGNVGRHTRVSTTGLLRNDRYRVGRVACMSVSVDWAGLTDVSGTPLYAINSVGVNAMTAAPAVHVDGLLSLPFLTFFSFLIFCLQGHLSRRVFRLILICYFPRTYTSTL